MSKLTEKQKKDYIAGGYNNCPHCKSTEINSSYSKKDDDWVECNVECDACGEEWTDVYLLADVQI